MNSDEWLRPESARGRRIAVVGGSGLLGSRLASALATAGAEVTVIGLREPRLFTGTTSYVRADIRIAGSLRDALRATDVVFLFAALLAKRCEEDPADGWTTNVLGMSHCLADVMACGRRPLVIFASSSSVYDVARASVPIAEGAPTLPRGLYAASKLAGEALLQTAAEAGGIPAVVLRPFSVYGPGPASGSRGHFVAAWMEQLVSGQPLTIYGDGLQTVDLTHVDDVAQVCLRVIASPPAAGQCVTWNVGSGVETAVGQVAQWIRELAPVEVLRVPATRALPRRLLADTTRARVELGYDPRVPAEAGIKDLVRLWIEGRNA